MDKLPVENGRVTYTEVVEVEGASKDQLFARAKKWFATTYKSSNDVIQLDDKENGEIVGKGNFGITYYARNPHIGHTISILVKDGRYKYAITGFTYTDDQGDKFNIEDFPKGWAGKKKLYTSVDENIKLIVASIEKAMKADQNDDW